MSGYPQQPDPTAPAYEKDPYAQQQQPPPQAHINPAQMAQPTTPGAATHQFQTSMPLSALSRSPAPVDCPSCGQRALTSVQYESGDNAQ